MIDGGFAEVQCSCGAWSPLPPVEVLRDRRTVVRCEGCQRRLPRPLLAERLRVVQEERIRELIRLDRAGLL